MCNMYDFLNQPLWGNDMFMVHRKKMIKAMYLSNWIKSGIIYIKDLIFEGSNLDEHFLFIFFLAILFYFSLWIFYRRRQHLTRLSFTIFIVITDVNAMRLSCIAYYDYG